MDLLTFITQNSSVFGVFTGLIVLIICLFILVFMQIAGLRKTLSLLKKMLSEKVEVCQKMQCTKIERMETQLVQTENKFDVLREMVSKVAEDLAKVIGYLEAKKD